MIRWILMAVFLAAALRGAALVNSCRYPDSSKQRSQILASLPKSAQARRYRFAPEAEIILGYGADAAPGRIGIDDNANGVVDDSGEIGAVGSDDICLAPSDTSYSAVRVQDGARVISRGAFIPHDNDGDDLSTETRYLLPGEGWFIVESLDRGQSD